MDIQIDADDLMGDYPVVLPSLVAEDESLAVVEYSPRLMNVILQKVHHGFTLQKICSLPLMPTTRQVYRWMDKFGYRTRYDAMRLRSGYTPELYHTMCNRIANGETLKAICAEESMPTHASFHRWRDMSNENKIEYRAAMLARTELHIDEALHIADGEPYQNEAGEIVQTLEETQRSKLRIETRWKLAGIHNADYADKKTTVIANPDGTGLLENATEIEIARRVAFLLTQGVVANG